MLTMNSRLALVPLRILCVYLSGWETGLYPEISGESQVR